MNPLIPILWRSEMVKVVVMDRVTVVEILRRCDVSRLVQHMTLSGCGRKGGDVQGRRQKQCKKYRAENLHEFDPLVDTVGYIPLLLNDAAQMALRTNGI